MMPKALRARLLLASLLLLPVFFGLTGFALQQAFHHSLEAAEEERLKLQVYLILGAAELRGDRIMIPDNLQEPRYSQVESGLYGFLHDRNELLVWYSESAKLITDDLLNKLDTEGLTTGESRFYRLPEYDVFVYQFALLWEIAGREHHYVFTVLESDNGVQTEQSAFNTRLWGWLSAAIFLFLLIETALIRWGLKPLTRLAGDLKRIELGQSDKLTGEYPTEVQAVTDNLNLLIVNERLQRERYRNTLGDLAHSLKTPLAVIQGAKQEKLNFDGYQTLVTDQASRMEQIVQYQLSRAVKSQGRTLAKKTPVAPLIERMVAALSKVYRDKNIEVKLQLAGDYRLPADERDLMELLGNILENAFKYGHQEIAVGFSNSAGMLQIDIADDGDGIAPELRKTILKRGERVDTSAPGQGIGLSVAVDILSSYDGELVIGESPLGGALFSIRMPLN